jgi:hypothetical protein
MINIAEQGDILSILLSPIEYHLYDGGWKIHHIVSDEVFKSKRWNGLRIYTDSPDYGSHTEVGSVIKTQHFEIVPGGANDVYYWRIFIENLLVCESRRFSTKGKEFIREFIKNEGLTTYEFHNKKFDLHNRELKYFSGQIVHFTDFRYHL